MRKEEGRDGEDGRREGKNRGKGRWEDKEGRG